MYKYTLIPHKQFGVIIVFLLSVQLILGWRHHAIFSKIHRHTWISITHVWLGRVIMGAGWCDLIFGLSLGGFGDKYIYLTAVIVCIEASALVVFRYWYNEAASETHRKTHREQRWGEEAANNFALQTYNSDDDKEPVRP